MEHLILSDLVDQTSLSDILTPLLSYNARALFLLAGSLLLLKMIKGSAANKHLLIALSIVAIFFLPLTSQLIPAIHIPISLSKSVTTEQLVLGSTTTTNHVSSSKDNTIPLLPWITVLYFSVSAFIIGRIIWGNLAVFFLKCLSTPVTHSRWKSVSQHYRQQSRIRRPIHILHSDNIHSPLTWGVLHPVVLIPTSALEWPEHLIKSTLLHEFAHIRRYDWFVMQFARCICAFYWINPLCWKSLRQLSIHSEVACDDMAINSGLQCSSYAADLVNVARQISRQKKYPMAALGMSSNTGSTDLGYRVRAILNSKTPHTPNSGLRVLITYSLVMSLFIPLSSLRAQYVYALTEKTVNQTKRQPSIQYSSSSEQALQAITFIDSIQLSRISVFTPESIIRKPEKATASFNKQHSEPTKQLTTENNHIDHSNENTSKAKKRTVRQRNSISKKLTTDKPTIENDQTAAIQNKPRTDKPTNNRIKEKTVGNTNYQLEDKTIELADINEDTAINTWNQKAEHLYQDQPLQTITVVEPFTREKMVKPNYPRRAIRRGIEGEVTVQFDIDTRGNVIRPKVINAKPSRIFNVSVLKAIKKYLFNPQRINGEAVNVQGVRETFTFVLQS